MKSLKYLLIMALSVVLMGCGSGTKKAEEQKPAIPKSLTIASGPIGGPWYAACTKASEILMREIPGLTVNVIEGGAESNMKLVESGRDAQIGMTSSLAASTMISGTGKDATKNVSAMMPIVSSYIQVVVPEASPIKQISDITGKKISAGKTGFASEVIFREILKAYNMDYNSVTTKGGTVSMLAWGEYPTLIGDGHLDMCALNGEIPHNIVMQMEADRPMRLLAVGSAEQKKVLEAMPALFIKEFPAGIYKGQKEPVSVFGYSGILVANNNMSDEFLIKIVEILQKHKAEITKELKFVDLLGWENATNGLNEKITRPAVWKLIQANSPKK